ncbi:carboxylating nicotinate-nucleotide diphosphorylase [Candidatus Methylospira mobilis]|uniref:Probable nicotinate-nucleotide pyrophosphorylase [carboxylating] n=1 Tax=Candidatus Methylospira mobilis TaxID=1808979 RepID=A0A5Q0BGY3_9GAMM|nr:carboxylating nicotinate-nucleotide diphosphorylase [Candidatus Methylospira mobilis]QFY41437.1 carboxylating nicotinate-nucleotide diphosphorylase [Candidatus Methylospira mobilis]
MTEPFAIPSGLSGEVARFIAEDVGSGDLTALIIPEHQQATAGVITREEMVLCGQAWFDAVFACLDRHIVVDWLARDGEQLKAGATLCRLSGNARALLTGERAALNLLQTLSATATLARRYAQAVAGLNVKVLDTRKTLPGLRQAQKYAVRCGGCHNHRTGLYDGILIKENHILAAGSIARALDQARALNSGAPIEIEVETLDELDQALAANAERVLLDNFSLEQLNTAVTRNARRAQLEVSGNVGLENIRGIAETGVDFISIGALTKNVQAIDLSMRINLDS